MSWKQTRLGDITSKIGSGATPRGAEKVYVPTGTPLIRSLNVHFDGFRSKKLVYIDEKEAAKLKGVEVKAGDILLNITGASIGRVTLAPADMDGARVNQHVAIIRPVEPHSGNFIRYYLRSPSLQRLIFETESGATRQALTKQKIENLLVPLPSPVVQNQIAQRLDLFLSKIDSSISRLQKIDEQLKLLKQTILNAAVNGAFTEAWRLEHGHIFPTERVHLRTVATSLQYGSSAKSSRSGKVPVLRMGNIQQGKLDWNDLVFTSNDSEIEKYLLKAGDVLFNRTNSPELVGKTAVFKGERDAIFAGYLIRIVCASGLVPDYLNFCLNSPEGKAFCWQVKSDGVSQSNINSKKIGEFQFFLPSIEEQKEIVRRVEKMFTAIDALEARIARGLDYSIKLMGANLDRAFKANLYEQDSQTSL